MNLTTLYIQIVIMFLLMGLGAVCYRRGIISDRGSKEISALLLNLVAPCLIIHSFERKYEPEMAMQLIQGFVLTLMLTALSAVIASLVFRRSARDYADCRMCSVFPNNGFMALPLLEALHGSEGVFLGSVAIVVTNIFLWTYGVQLLTNAAGQTHGTIHWRKIVLNPGTVGFYIGLLIFLTPLSLPTVISTPVEYLSNLNTPLAMLVLGVYLAQSNLLDILRDRSMYLVSLVRLVIIPAVSIAVMLLLPLDPQVEQVILIGISTPCAIAASMFAQQYGTNYRYSSRIIAFSTLLSAISLPIVMSVYQLLV
ncbi:MAG: AEC family transporter [Butyricicoccus sp.]